VLSCAPRSRPPRSRQVARVVYGAIIGLTLIVAVEDHPPSAAVLASWLVLTGVTVALAVVYSEVIGLETSERRCVTRHQVAHPLGQGWAVTIGVAFPAVFFLLAVVDAPRAGHRLRHRGVERARPDRLLWLLGARFAGTPVPRALAQAAAVGALGGIVIAFKALVHEGRRRLESSRRRG